MEGFNKERILGEEEEEFCSCCGEEEEEEEEGWGDENHDIEKDAGEFGVHMYFKGVSMPEAGDMSSGFTGIGVVMERSAGISVIQVQKKLDFYVEETVADYLALMDGLMEALGKKMKRVFAFTDSEIIFNQVAHEKRPENHFLVAMRERILELANRFDYFVLKHVSDSEVEQPLRLAKIAIGIVCLSPKKDELLEDCPICCEKKPTSMMLTMKCSHNFCSHCLRTYVNKRVQTSQVPIRCPRLRCKYVISASECSSFLPVSCYKLLEKAFIEASILSSVKVYCPFPNCSALFDPRECMSSRATSTTDLDVSCLECPACGRYLCSDCGVPWHSSMICEEYQNLPIEKRDTGGISVCRLAQNEQWKRCQQCRCMIELIQGCYHMTCSCGHEFCYACEAEYTNGQQTCQCAYWDENTTQNQVTQPENIELGQQWEWDTFDSLQPISDAYTDQELSQLALIQRFLSGGFDLSDYHPYQSPPRCSDSYMDTIKDLHQLPWLERFVSVISDNYYEEYRH